MMRGCLGLLVVLALAGCGSAQKQEPGAGSGPPSAMKPATGKPSKPVNTMAAQPSGGGSGGNIAPIGPNVGGMTPVAGSDSVEGAGMGGLGNAAKSAARKAADQSQGQAQPPGDSQE